jgi:methylated-DNA-[protein]-cysteine S-methyltransferase
MKKSDRNASVSVASRIIDSPVGRLYLAATEAGLTHVLFVEKMSHRPDPLEGSGQAANIVRETERQLTEYFNGHRREFDLPLAPAGTEFQLATWRALRDIPFGETVSYGELARRMNKPDAVRAVGAANGANPISIIVPCHRVIGADGTLTGYGGGVHVKKRLLELEQGMRTWL